MRSQTKFRRIAVASNPKSEGSLETAAEVAGLLADHGADVIYGRMDDPDIRAAVEEGSVDLMVALGGDGTMLRAGHLCAPVDVPVIGVHLGSFGFLTEIQEDQWQSALPRIFSDHLWYERRMMLRICFSCRSPTTGISRPSRSTRSSCRSCARACGWETRPAMTPVRVWLSQL